MAKSTCNNCNRTVLMVQLGNGLVATDPELISVVTATDESHPGRDMPAIRMSTRQTFARRLHSERCEDYQNQARRDRISAEMRQFTKNQAKPKRNRGL